MPHIRNDRPHELLQGEFLTCPQHRDGYSMVIDRTTVHVVDGLWEWKAPRCEVSYGCCPDRVFEIEGAQEWNEKHPRYAGLLDPARGELPARRLVLRLRRDREQDLVVIGAELLAEASSFTPGAQRWTELRLWRSGSGQFVAEQVGRSITPGERDRCRAWVCADQAEVVKRLSRGWLSRQLFAAAGIDDAERVD